MKAVAQTGYGDPGKVLSLTEVSRPQAEGKQVLVRVVATSVNAGDWRVVYANPFLVRLVGGVRRPKDPINLGGDIAGVVEAVGAEVTELKIGDEVFGIRHPAYADYVAGESFVRAPSNLTLEQAATVPIAGVTALQALHKHGDLKPGQRVVITGAGGGVGSFAVQIAKHAGAHVTAVTSADKAEFVSSLGADRVLDYRKDDFTREGERYDLIVDVAGMPTIKAMRRALAAGGRIVLVGAGRGRFGTIGRVAGTLIRRKLGQPVKFFIASGPYLEQLTTLREMIEAGKVTPAIDRTYTLADVAEAIRYAGTEQTRGKVAIRVG